LEVLAAQIGGVLAWAVGAGRTHGCGANSSSQHVVGRNQTMVWSRWTSRPSSSRTERLAKAIAVFEQAALPDPPDYAQLSATRAYRDVHRVEDAVSNARDGMRRFPANPTWPLLLLAVAPSDAGQTTEALA
jgi:hypothetical protein